MVIEDPSDSWVRDEGVIPHSNSKTHSTIILYHFPTLPTPQRNIRELGCTCVHNSCNIVQELWNLENNIITLCSRGDIIFFTLNSKHVFFALEGALSLFKSLSKPVLLCSLLYIHPEKYKLLIHKRVGSKSSPRLELLN